MTKVPSVPETIKYLALLYFLEDFFFYSAHYLLHTPFLYRHVHKIHHEYNTSVSIAGFHMHIFEAFLSNGLPSKIYISLVSLAFGEIHITIVTIWMILRMYDAHNGHSGYNFSWTPIQILPFCANDDFHDFHHSHNCGNYSSQLRIWDIVFGTSKPFKEYKKKTKKGRK